MKIDQVNLHQIEIPMRFQFSQANNTTSKSNSAILELITATGIRSYGEACPRLYVTGESMAAVKKDLTVIASALKRTDFESTEDIVAQLQNWEATGIGSSTQCALELALLDAWSRTQETPIYQMINRDRQPPTEITYSLVLPLLKPTHFAALLNSIQFFQPKAIKLKVDNNMTANLERLRLIREHIGEAVPVRVDVNAGWTLVQARQFIPRFLEAGVTSFEQPLAADQLDGLAELTATFGKEASIMADESLVSFASAKELLQKQCCNHFNLKLSKLGGILRSLAVYRAAEQAGVPCQLGAHFGETSLLSAAGVILTALAGNMTANEGALGNFLLEKDLFDPPVQHQRDGQLAVAPILDNIGLGGNLDRILLENYALEHSTF